ncbi:MAG: hypothetical protein JO073_11720 [Actinobacteria bacterium]|nr:hypothetical protein [Actinomycetota bacterium]
MSSGWPLGEHARAHARPSRPRKRARPRRTLLFAALAFAAGALVTAAGFSVGLHHRAQQQTSVQTELDAANARTDRLAASLAAARANVTRARRAQTQASTAARTVSKEATTLATELAAAGKSADSVSVGSASLGSDLGKLASELRTLTTYLGSTPVSQLDAGYVATQTAYLSKQLDRLTGEQSDLASAVADFESGVKALSDRAATLSGSN